MSYVKTNIHNTSITQTIGNHLCLKILNLSKKIGKLSSERIFKKEDTENGIK